MSWKRLWATWTCRIASAPPTRSRNTSQCRCAGLYEPISPATIERSKWTPIASIDASIRSRSVFERIAEPPAALARLRQPVVHVLEHRPRRKRARERARLALRKRQAGLGRERLERDREHLAVRRARVRRLDLRLELVVADEQARPRARRRRASRARRGCRRSSRRASRSSRTSPTAPCRKPSLRAVIEIRRDDRGRLARGRGDLRRGHRDARSDVRDGASRLRRVRCEPPLRAPARRCRERPRRGLGRSRSDVVARVLRRSRRELGLHRGERARPRNRPRAHGGR